VPNVLDEFLGASDNGYPAPKTKKARKAKALTLEQVLYNGLPHYRMEYRGYLILDSKRLARDMGISYQALYQWFVRNRVSAKRAKQLIAISEKYQRKFPREEFTPLTRDDFWEFYAK
jgi:hypothetical protein